jgi:signal transduction histidine kinase
MLQPVAGNLQAWPLEVGSTPGWYQIKLDRNGKLRTARVLFVFFPGGYRLLVGRDIHDRLALSALIVDALTWASVTAFVLAALGAWFLRKAILRRVDVINRTANAIVQGRLSQRVPIQGSSDEFDRLTDTINAMLAEIEHLVHGVRNASNVVAHDLRTPLAELRSRLEGLLRTRPSADTTFDEIHKAVGDVDRLIGIFNALLRLAEIDSGMRRSAFRPVDLAEIALQVVDLYAPWAEEKDLTLRVDTAGSMRVDGDPDLLAQAVGNLIDNAIKYVPPQGRVSLRIARCGQSQVSIEVADNGPGIAEAEKLRVTERFYRGDQRSGIEGTGLGLSVVEAVARLHGGSLSLRDNNPGLAAELILPLSTNPPSRLALAPAHEAV